LPIEHIEHIEHIEPTEQTQQIQQTKQPEKHEQPEQHPKGTATTFEYTTPNFIPAESWETFSRGNAWDEVPEINKYVDAIQQRSKNANGRGGKAGGAKRPESLKITDFPTEVDRPSLPVTPAPMRRSFWESSEGQQESSEFPAAEGVPNQGDWVGVTTDAFLQLLIAIYSYWKVTEPTRSTGRATTAPVGSLQNDDEFSGANRVVRRD
jgi:hypothetical protein